MLRDIHVWYTAEFFCPIAGVCPKWLAMQRTIAHVMNQGEIWRYTCAKWNIGKMGTDLQGGY